MYTGSVLHIFSFSLSEFTVNIGTVFTKWKLIAKYALQIRRRSLHVVHYEDLINDARQQLRNICHFLNFTINEDRLHCLDRAMEGRFHRIITAKEREKQYLAVNVFDAVLNITKNIESISKMLNARGFKPVHPFVAHT